MIVTEVEGSAFGYTSQVGLFEGPANVRPCANPPVNTVDCRPRPSVTLPAAGAAVPITDTVPTADARYGPGIIFTSGPISVSTQGTTGLTGSVTSTATIQTTNTSEVEVFTADNVSGTCTANEAGVTGSTTITNGTLRISEGDPDVDGDDTVVSVPTNPPPNTSISGVIEGVGDSFTYIFNEQIVDPATGALTVNAGHQILEGPTAIGDLFIGHVVCGLTTIQATTTTTATSSTTLPPSSTSTSTTSTTLPPPPPTGGSKYVMLAKDGGVFAPGGEGFFGTARVRPGDGMLRDDQGRIIGASGSPLDSPVVCFAYTPTRQGYWLAPADGGVIPIGDAPDVGDLLDLPLSSPIVGVAATTDGGAFTYGVAFAGSLATMTLDAPIVGIAADPDGAGYWMAGADGGVFVFDAAFSGDVAALLLNSPISGIAALQQPPRPPSDR